MAKFTSRATLDLSTGHLSAGTRELMNAWHQQGFKGANFSFSAREYGFYVKTSLADNENLPFDLRHALNFARANGQDAIDFDCDGEKCDLLPYYGDGQKPEMMPEGYLLEHFTPDSSMVRPGAFTMEDLNQGLTELAEDGDYKAERGCYIDIGNVTVRLLRTGVEGDDVDHAVHITVLPASDCLANPFNELTIYESEVDAQYNAEADEPDLM